MDNEIKTITEANKALRVGIAAVERVKVLEIENLRLSKELTKAADFAIRIRELTKENELLREDKAFFSNQWELVSKELNELKNK